jgi:hypothetical protein
MSVESSFLAAVSGFLRSALQLPAAAVGVADPVEETDLPRVVLSLRDLHRERQGVGAALPPGPGLARLSGLLRAVVWGKADEADGVAQLSADMVGALLSPAATKIQGLVSLDLVRLGSVGAPAVAAHHGRRRSARFRFVFQQAEPAIPSDEGPLKTVDIHLPGLGRATKPEDRFQVGEPIAEKAAEDEPKDEPKPS